MMGEGVRRRQFLNSGRCDSANSLTGDETFPADLIE